MSKKSIEIPFSVKSAYFSNSEISFIPYGSGHIQDTFYVEDQGEKFLIQRINQNVFPKPKEVMENIIKVTGFLKEKMAKENRNVLREVMTVVPTKEGKAFFIDEKGDFWRNYIFIDETITYQLPENEEVFYEAARTFGDFQQSLSEFPAKELHETIENFHNTPARVDQLKKAIKNASEERLTNAKEEIDFAKERFEKAGILMEKLEKGTLPLRVTHNDTKLNNVLIDKETGKGLCVVDLDTVMPGLAAFDFGDAIRFGANTAVENEMDVDKVSLSLPLFKAYAKGYLEKTAKTLTKEEINSLPIGAKLITYETGLRFLADYLNNDVYFKISFPQENLIRARNQFALVKDMENKWDEMVNIINQYTNKRS